MAKKKVAPVKKTVAKKKEAKTKSATTKSAKTAPKSKRLQVGKAGSIASKMTAKKVAPKGSTPKASTKKVVKKAIQTIAQKGSLKKALVKPVKTLAKPVAKKIKGPSELLTDAIVEGVLEVKGRNISVLNLQDIHNRVCDYFIICQADSTTQVNAIAGSVEEMVKKLTGERPYRKEGFENSEWILVDYVTVVVHIFQTEVRNFYNLESLWADAEVTEIAFDK